MSKPGSLDLVQIARSLMSRAGCRLLVSQRHRVEPGGEIRNIPRFEAQQDVISEEQKTN